MLIHASFVPHSPLLLENIHPESHAQVANTSEAVKSIAEDLYALKPDVLVVISGLGDRYSDAFSIDLSEEYLADLRPFGDLSKPETFYPATHIIDGLQRHLRKSEIPFTLGTNEMLEYGTAVALKLLTKEQNDIRIVPIAYSDLSRKEHHQFGQALREVLDGCPERVAVVAAGDLSHCLSSSAPGGFCKEGKEFDDSVVSAVNLGSLSNLLAIPETTIDEAHENGYNPLLVLYGLLDKRQFVSKVLSYESPFGVGYLVAQFHLK